MKHRKLLDSHGAGHRGNINIVAGSSSMKLAPSVQFLYHHPLQYSATTNNDTSLDDHQQQQQQQPYKPTLGFDSSMALTVLVLLSALFFMVFFSMYLRRFADDDPTTNISRRRRLQQLRASANAAVCSSSSNGLDPDTIRSLPLFAYDGNAKEPIDCPVCLSEFEEKETIKVIPYCGHVFHPECIDTWFSSHVSCPLCRSTQLFRSSSTLNKEDEEQRLMCSSSTVLMMKSVVVVGSESLERSTVRSGDTWRSGTEETSSSSSSSSSGSGGVRRISSCSCLEGKMSLRRNFSF